MPKFMSSHTMPAGALKREQVDQMAKAAQSDPVAKPYRSFLNLAEGKVLCVMEAPSKDALAAWFSTMQMPCDLSPRSNSEGSEAGSERPEQALRKGSSPRPLTEEDGQRIAGYRIVPLWTQFLNKPCAILRSSITFADS
jgi:hypothetical protein